RSEPRPEPSELQMGELRAIRNAMAGWTALPQQPNGLILQLQNGGSVLATRPAGLVAINCSSNMTCTFSGGTFTLNASVSAGAAFNAVTSGTNTTATMTLGSGGT